MKDVLSDWEKSLYTKDLNFSITNKKLNYVLVKFELFFRGIHNLEIFWNEDLDFFKEKTKKVALTSYRTYNKNVPQNLSNDEFIALQNLSRNKD